MKKSIHEIADRVYRISLKSEMLPLQFNHFLIDDDEPLLMHMGHLATFNELRELVAKVLEPQKIRHFCFSHLESDECGAIEPWLDTAPSSTVTVGPVCYSSIKDAVPHRSRALGDGRRLCLGERYITLLETPHLPHNWDACMFYLEQEKVLFSSDLGTQFGDCAPIAAVDISEEIVALQRKVGYMPVGLDVLKGLKKVAQLDINQLAVMHGSVLGGSQSQRLFQLLSDDIRTQMISHLEGFEYN